MALETPDLLRSLNMDVVDAANTFIPAVSAVNLSSQRGRSRAIKEKR